MLQDVSFGAVPYGGTGKYGDDSFFVPTGTFERLIDPSDEEKGVPQSGNRSW